MGWLRGFDRKIFHLSLAFSQENSFHKWMRRVSRSGDWGMIWVVVCLVLLCWRQYRRTVELCMIALLFTTVLGEGILKRVFKRPRPYITHGPVKMSVPAPSSFSFPSGHTASSVACACVLALLSPWAAFCAYAYALLMGFSRVYLKTHYVSDVIAGALVGLVCANTVLWLFR